MWKDLNNQNDVDDFMKQFNMFHDAYMLETKYITGTYEQKSADIFVKSTMYILFQLDKLRCLEMELDMLDRFAINLNLKCSFEIYEARFEKKEDGFYWYSDEYADEDANYWFRCQTIRWREIPLANQSDGSSTNGKKGK